MSNIQKAVDKIIPIFQVTEDALSSWKGDGCLQFPELLTTISLKMNWEAKQIRAYDPIIRMYVREHDEWYVTRGAKGGIMRKATKLQKDAAKSAAEAAKAAIKALLENKIDQKSEDKVSE